MLVRLPIDPNETFTHVSTATRVIRLVEADVDSDGYDGWYVTVLVGDAEVSTSDFESRDAAQAWADEVARLVNEATKPKCSVIEEVTEKAFVSPQPPSFSDWQPTPEQAHEAVRIYKEITATCKNDSDWEQKPIGLRWLTAWQRVCAEMGETK